MLARTKDMTSQPAMFSACLLSSLDTWATWLSISRSSLSISECWAACAASDTVNLTRSGCWHWELGAEAGETGAGAGEAGPPLASDLGAAGDPEPGLLEDAGSGAWDCDFLVDGRDFWVAPASAKTYYHNIISSVMTRDVMCDTEIITIIIMQSGVMSHW